MTVIQMIKTRAKEKDVRRCKVPELLTMMNALTRKRNIFIEKLEKGDVIESTLLN